MKSLPPGLNVQRPMPVGPHLPDLCSDDHDGTSSQTHTVACEAHWEITL